MKPKADSGLDRGGPSLPGVRVPVPWPAPGQRQTAQSFGWVCREPVHELKTLREPFRAICRGTKRHEIRKADRNFRPGDMLWLREFDGKDYTGLEAWAVITYISEPGTFGMPAGLCVLSIRLIAHCLED